MRKVLFYHFYDVEISQTREGWVVRVAMASFWCRFPDDGSTTLSFVIDIARASAKQSRSWENRFHREITFKTGFAVGLLSSFRARQAPASRKPRKPVATYICPSPQHQHTFRETFKCVEICNLFSCLRCFSYTFFLASPFAAFCVLWAGLWVAPVRKRVRRQNTHEKRSMREKEQKEYSAFYDLTYDLNFKCPYTWACLL